MEHIHCNNPDCSAKIKNNAWAKTRASDWFFGKTGEAYCPAHIPAWVEEWRKKKGNRRY